ncbi:MAG: acetyl-CoA carboxylase [Pseudomonadota bacterium]
MPKTIQAPVPGTFYRKPSPDQPPFIPDGGAIAVGDTIGLIEVMKTFIEIKAEEGGANARFVVEDENPVLAGAPLVEFD